MLTIILVYFYQITSATTSIYIVKDALFTISAVCLSVIIVNARLTQQVGATNTCKIRCFTS